MLQRLLNRYAPTRHATHPARVTAPLHQSRHSGVGLGSALHTSHCLARPWPVPDGGSGPQGPLTRDVGYAVPHRAVGTPASYPREGPARGGALPRGRRKSAFEFPIRRVLYQAHVSVFSNDSNRLARFSQLATRSVGHCTSCWGESAHRADSRVSLLISCGATLPFLP